ncbi:MAG TPA: 16S rRNA (cytosine(967)-C(5))-methyltransferase RsmB [Candidatus Binatia bacterium]
MITSADQRNPSVRSLAGEILLKVDTRKAYADVLLDRALKTTLLNERDRALLTELVYGTLRWRGKIDAELTRHLRRPLSDTAPLIRSVLRLAAYQICFLDRIPDYAAVNEAVALAKLYGSGKSAGFVNGVLRNLLRQKDHGRVLTTQDETTHSVAVEYSHPEWLVQRWIKQFGVLAAKQLMRANNERAPLLLRVNSLSCARDQLLQRFPQSGIGAMPSERSPHGIIVNSGGSIENLPGFAEGFFQVQGESSQLVVFLLSPVPGERILDACAAPGGKTTHIAELMKDRGEVVAIDKSASAIKKLGENIARLRIQSARLRIADATQGLSPSLRGPYDRILVDAPCSGLGTLRSHPEIKWHRDERDIQRLRALQSKILCRMADYLKPGGILVYSTCTLTRDENEETVESFLAEQPKFELQDAARYLPDKAKHMISGKYFQALPHRDNTDGFFAARLRKVF